MSPTASVQLRLITWKPDGSRKEFATIVQELTGMILLTMLLGFLVVLAHPRSRSTSHHLHSLIYLVATTLGI